MTKTIKRDLSDIAHTSAMNIAAMQLPANRLQEIASGYTSAMKALELHTNTYSSLNIASRMGLDSLSSRISEQLSFSHIRAFDDIIRQQNKIADVFKQSFGSNSFNQLIMQAQGLQSSLAFQEIIKNNSFSALEQILPHETTLSAWARVLQEYEEINSESEDDVATDQHIENIIDNLDTVISSPDPERMSFSELRANVVAICTIVGFLLMLIQTIQALQSDEQQERLISAFEKQTEMLTLFAEKYSEQSAGKIIYVVKRHVPLSSTQSFQKNRLMLLYPQQEVEVLDFDGKWVNVEAYDMQTGKTHRGWVLKKYMRRKGEAAELPTRQFSNQVTNL